MNGCVPGTPIARLPLLRLPETRARSGDDPGHRTPAGGSRDRYRYSRHGRLQPRRPDFGATCGFRGPGGRRVAARRRNCISSTIWIRDSFESCLQGCRTRPRASSRSRNPAAPAETLMQTIAALSALKEAGLQTRIPDIFLGISEPAKSGKMNGLARSARQIPRAHARPRYRCRRSLFGADQCRSAARGDAGSRHCRGPRRRRPRAGAGVLAKKPATQVPAAVGAALSVALSESKGKSISVLMAYCDRLQRFTHWYVQLWAESLGKNGKGTTPLAALGPVDQHSQLQLFIGGPRDKLFTVVTVGGAGQRSVHRRRTCKTCGRARLRRQDASAIWLPPKAARLPRRSRRTVARCGRSTSTGSMRKPSAS